jgi:hypothetical protein
LYRATVNKLIGKFKRWKIERVFQQQKTKNKKKEERGKKSAKN